VPVLPEFALLLGLPSLWLLVSASSLPRRERWAAYGQLVAACAALVFGVALIALPVGLYLEGVWLQDAVSFLCFLGLSLVGAAALAGAARRSWLDARARLGGGGPAQGETLTQRPADHASRPAPGQPELNPPRQAG
jgi:hypothetical protein